MKDFSIILAVDNENGIGAANDLAWDIPDDRKYFRKITCKTQDPNKQNAVIMGRVTWESIPEKFRPFSKRKNFVLSRSYENNTQNTQGASLFADLDSCLESMQQDTSIENVFIIGGAQLYNQVLSDKRLQKAYITRIYYKYHCDRFFDGLPTDFRLESRSEMQEHDGIEFEYSVYFRRISLLRKFKTLFHK